MRTKLFSFVITVAATISALPSLAQVATPNEDTGLEELYDKFEDQEVQQKARKRSQRQSKESEELSKISELVTLSPFEDIAVIQRRFLPKTSRFEVSAAAAISANNAFFNNVGLGLRMAYYFSEKYGIEGTYMFLNSSERPITEELRKDPIRIATASLVEPEAYYGASFKWSPVYGKMAWLGETIVPFDIHFTPGFGLTQTAQGDTQSTFSFGMGQLFAISKSSGLRWDITWNFYQATVEVNGRKEKDNHNDLLLSFGYSFFFPEATYR